VDSDQDGFPSRKQKFSDDAVFKHNPENGSTDRYFGVGDERARYGAARAGFQLWR
jgi:hypothetical protein